MFDLGMQELIVIFVVALLVFGPKRLPELSRALGRGMREIKIALRGVKDSFDEVESQIEEGVTEATGMKTDERDQKPEDVDSSQKQGEEGEVREDHREKADNG
jgi:TatA/E family protein of Tat protein translocase